VLAVVLAGLGLYGAFAFYVRQRQREIGIRMALGAEARRVERLVLRQGAVRLAVGIVLGLLGAVFAARWLVGELAGVTPTDPVALLAAPAVLAAVALGATWLPAMRAARIDPAAVLREE
jgi:putative ABC transport system permease protein